MARLANAIVRKMPRAWLHPFELAFAAIIISQGVVALTGRGIVNPANALLPHWLAIAFQIAYILAGLAISIGLLLPRGDVEGGGLILLATDLMARAILFGQFLGWNLQSVTSLTFSAFLTLACIARLAMLISGLTVVLIRRDGDDDVP